jgi:hypothetical protein
LRNLLGTQASSLPPFHKPAGWKPAYPGISHFFIPSVCRPRRSSSLPSRGSSQADRVLIPRPRFSESESTATDHLVWEPGPDSSTQPSSKSNCDRSFTTLTGDWRRGICHHAIVFSGELGCRFGRLWQLRSKKPCSMNQQFRVDRKPVNPPISV